MIGGEGTVGVLGKGGRGGVVGMREVLELLGGYGVDVCVLAGYMLVVGSGLCRAWPMLNLHPALPDGPVGSWQEVVWRLIAERAGVTGVMTHLVTEDVDRGPVVSYVTGAVGYAGAGGALAGFGGAGCGRNPGAGGGGLWVVDTGGAVPAGMETLRAGRGDFAGWGAGDGRRGRRDAAGYGGVCMDRRVCDGGIGVVGVKGLADRRVDRAMAESGLSG